jgi:hypothetical protein
LKWDAGITIARNTIQFSGRRLNIARPRPTPGKGNPGNSERLSYIASCKLLYHGWADVSVDSLLLIAATTTGHNENTPWLVVSQRLTKKHTTYSYKQAFQTYKLLRYFFKDITLYTKIAMA